jgi:transposase, IS5 family
LPILPNPAFKIRYTRLEQRMGADKLTALMQESLATAVRMEAAKRADFKAVIVDTTVQEKAISPSISLEMRSPPMPN